MKVKYYISIWTHIPVTLKRSMVVSSELALLNYFWIIQKASLDYIPVVRKIGVG